MSNIQANANIYRPTSQANPLSSIADRGEGSTKTRASRGAGAREWQSMFTGKDITLFTAVNARNILEECLMNSPDIRSGALTPLLMEDYPSASIAYSEAISKSTTELSIFVHQDIYLPVGWLDRFLSQVNKLTRDHPDWAVAGVYGVCASGTHVGRLWDVTLGRELGAPGFPATEVESLDEVLIAVRRTPGLDFDRALPRFHLYGTDIVQTARSLGRSAFAVEAPIVHNNRPIGSLAGDYAEAYRFARRKWRDRLPITTTICRLTYNPFSLWRAQWRRRRAGARPAGLLADARVVAAAAGYE